MKALNNMIWKNIFSILRPLSDNIGFNIIVTSFIFAILFLVAKKAFHRPFQLNILEYIFIYSVGSAVIQLPNIHYRMNLALKTISGIISNSEVYKASFVEVTGIDPTGPKSIASYLYYLPRDKRFIFDNANPRMLYEHCFSTMDKIKDLFQIQTLTEACFGTLNIFFILVIIIIICTINKNHWIHWLIQSLFLLYATTINAAMVLSFFCIFIIYWFADIFLKKRNNT